MMKRKGFTLTEIIIAVAILGVIAAVTIAPLATKNDPGMPMFKKAYSITVQTVADLLNDATYYTNDFSGIEANMKGFAGASKFCNSFADLVGASDVNCNATISLDNGGNFKTKDGIIWSMPMGAAGNIMVDINGTKGPNSNLVNSRPGPDRFAIRVLSNGNIELTGVSKAYAETNNKREALRNAANN